MWNLVKILWATALKIWKSLQHDINMTWYPTQLYSITRDNLRISIYSTNNWMFEHPKTTHNRSPHFLDLNLQFNSQITPKMRVIAVFIQGVHAKMLLDRLFSAIGQFQRTTKHICLINIFRNYFQIENRYDETTRMVDGFDFIDIYLVSFTNRETSSRAIHWI